jgi:hypothetical protein
VSSKLLKVAKGKPPPVYNFRFLPLSGHGGRIIIDKTRILSPSLPALTGRHQVSGGER